MWTANPDTPTDLRTDLAPEYLDALASHSRNDYRKVRAFFIG
jgi:hypothetical protein